MRLKPQKKLLKNGLTLVTVPMGSASVSAVLLGRVGSRDESVSVNGMSHFLEHMVFKGTKKWPTSREMNQVIDSVGGVYNAFTSHENTGFWVKLAKKHLKLGLEYLQQAVFEPLLPADELERERGVILEEIKMYEDNPMANVAKSFVAQLYQGTTLGQQIIGTAANIRSLKRDQFYRHLKRWYQPKNMVLTVAGGIDGNVGRLATEVFNNNFTSQVKFARRVKEIKVEKTDKIRVVSKDIKQAHFCLGMTTFRRGHQDRYALAVLNTVLGANSSSRLFEEIRNKRGLVYYVRTGLNSFYETGYLVAQAGCDVKRVGEAVKVTVGEYDKMTGRVSGITDEELTRAKEYLKGRLALDLEDSQEVAGMFGEDLLMENKLRPVEELYRGVEKVTAVDVTRVAKAIFSPERLRLTVVGPFKGKNEFAKLV